MRALRESWTLTVLTLLACASMLSGCSVARTPANPVAREAARAAAIVPPPGAWPARWTEGLHPCIAADVQPAQLLGPAHAKLPPSIEVLSVRRFIPMGQGLVSFDIVPEKFDPDFRDWETWESDEAVRGVHLFNYYSWDQRERPVWDLPEGRTENPDAKVALQRAINRASMTAKFRLLMPEQGTPKGVVLFVPPISAAKLSLPVPRELLKRGWAVLSVDRIEVLQFSRTATVIDVPWAPRPKGRKRPKGPEPPPGPAGRWMAEWIRGDMADMAYAYQTGLDFAERTEPVLKGVPLVVLGTSLGAIFTPPVVARLGDRVDGAVLIGGGADMLRVMAETDPDIFNVGLLYAEGDVRLTKERGKKWDADYLAANPLDPVFTAPLLAKVPTLMLHARQDGIVRAPFGDMLWEKAGKPERWTIDSGHLWLFFTLNERAAKIADWIEANVHDRHHAAP